jgi:hypothetical protein
METLKNREILQQVKFSKQHTSQQAIKKGPLNLSQCNKEVPLP